MAISKDLQDKLDYYEQVYYALDEPIPFKEDLLIYPVLVKDYYKFYSSFGCLTMDKTTKMGVDENGVVKKVTNIKGLGQTYMAYLIDMMEDQQFGQRVTAEVMELFELIFHKKKGMFCPKCGKHAEYAKMFDGIEEYEESVLKEKTEQYTSILKENILAENPDVNLDEVDQSIFELPEDLKKQIQLYARAEFLQKGLICPDCGEKMRDVFSIKTISEDNKILVVENTEIDSNDFELLKALVPRQNILDYDGDKYVDPELKEELDLKAKLQNKDYTSPTLEKQIVCVAIGTGYTIEYLHGITMRKLSMLLRLIDKEKYYYAAIQGEMSGMVSFKPGSEPKHWIFSDDKKNIKDELTDLDSFTKKFDKVT